MNRTKKMTIKSLPALLVTIALSSVSAEILGQVPIIRPADSPVWNQGERETEAPRVIPIPPIVGSGVLKPAPPWSLGNSDTETRFIPIVSADGGNNENERAWYAAGLGGNATGSDVAQTSNSENQVPIVQGNSVQTGTGQAGTGIVPIVRNDSSTATHPLTPNTPPTPNAPWSGSNQQSSSVSGQSLRNEGPDLAVPIIKPVSPMNFGSTPSSQRSNGPSASGLTPMFSQSPTNANTSLSKFRQDSQAVLSTDTNIDSVQRSEAQMPFTGSDSMHYGSEVPMDVGSNYLDQPNFDSQSCDGCGYESCTDCAVAFPSLQGIGGRLRPTGELRGRLRHRIAHVLPNVGGDIFHFGFDQCGYISNANRYVQVDALYWTRGDGGVIGTNFGGPTDYPHTWGWRTTLGWREDAIRSYEMTYFGFTPFESTTRQLSPAGAIDARFLPAGGFGATQTSSFYNAVDTSQTLTTQFHSLEFARARFGWDVVKSSLGLRYMWFEDEYRLDTINNVGDVGIFRLQANNHLIGPDMGLELLYDVGRRISFSGKAKAGAYLDIYRHQTNLVNNGIQYVGNENNATNVAASLELGANAYLRLGRNARLRGGYDALWLYNVLSVSDNYPGLVTPVTGFDPDDSRNVSLHGASFGIEFYR